MGEFLDGDNKQTETPTTMDQDIPHGEMIDRDRAMIATYKAVTMTTTDLIHRMKSIPAEELLRVYDEAMNAQKLDDMSPANVEEASKAALEAVRDRIVREAEV